MTLQVGQCGNQVGCRFWDLILREHVLHNRVGMFNQALSAYFTDADARCGASSQDARALRPEGRSEAPVEHPDIVCQRVTRPDMPARRDSMWELGFGRVVRVWT